MHIIYQNLTWIIIIFVIFGYNPGNNNIINSINFIYFIDFISKFKFTFIKCEFAIL